MFLIVFLSFMLPQSTNGVGPNHAVIVLYTMSSDYSKIMQILNPTAENHFHFQWTQVRFLPGKILVVYMVVLCHENYNLGDEIVPNIIVI